MVYYESSKKGKKKKYGISIGAGPVKITSAQSSLRKQVMNVKKSVKEITNREELKYKDTFLNNVSITSTATLTLLNGLTLGDDVSNRTGDEISPTSIQCRMLVSQTDTTIQSDTTLRHIVFWDSQPNGSAPSAGDVIDLATITLALLAPYKRQYQKRFKILYDQIVVMKPHMAEPGSTTQILSPNAYRHFKKSLSRVVKYRNAQNTGTITDIGSNSLYSLLVSNGGIAVYAGYRMYFKDD